MIITLMVLRIAILRSTPQFADGWAARPGDATILWNNCLIRQTKWGVHTYAKYAKYGYVSILQMGNDLKHDFASYRK